MPLIKAVILGASRHSYVLPSLRGDYGVADDIAFLERPKRQDNRDLWSIDVPGVEGINLAYGLTKLTPELIDLIENIQGVQYRSERVITQKQLATGSISEFERQGNGIIYDPEKVLFQAHLAPRLGLNWEDMVVASERPSLRKHLGYSYKVFGDGLGLLKLETPYKSVSSEMGRKPIKEESLDNAFRQAAIDVGRDGQIRQLKAEDGIMHTFTTSADAEAIVRLNQLAQKQNISISDLVEQLVKAGPAT